MSRPLTAHARSGLTLIELIAAITIMSVISVAGFPVIASAADGYASATRTRERTERIAFALDRCVRLLREATGSDPAGALDLASAAPDRVVFADGRGLGLSGTTLVYLEAGKADAPLCRDVTAFEITYLGSDGVTSTIGAPETTQRFNVSITADGLTLTGAAFARTRIGD
ncbi:MAG: type II secretion system protein [Phycisphaerales bacterium JB059]